MMALTWLPEDTDRVTAISPIGAVVDPHGKELCRAAGGTCSLP